MLLQARIKQVEGNKINLEADLVDCQQAVYAEARGLFILQDLNTFKEMSQLSPEVLEFFTNLSKPKS